MNFWTQLSQNFVGGLAAGIIGNAGSRMIEEYVPLAMFSTA